MKGRAFMKGAEFKARQGWLPFVDAVGIALRELEPIKAAAWAWFRAWKNEGREKVKKPQNKGLMLMDLLNFLPWADQPKLC